MFKHHPILSSTFSASRNHPLHNSGMFATPASFRSLATYWYRLQCLHLGSPRQLVTGIPLFKSMNYDMDGQEGSFRSIPAIPMLGPL